MPSVSASDLRAMLDRIPLLKGLDDTLLNRLATIVRVRSYRRRAHVILKGSVGDEMFFVLHGKLQVVDTSDSGREVGVNMIETGDIFGELSLIDGEPRSASVVAVSETLLAFLPRGAALNLFFHNPLVAERMLQRMARRLRDVSKYQTLVAIPNAFARIYALLQQLAEQEQAGAVAIENMPTHQQLAIMANASRETVTRAIRSLVRAGVLEKDHRRLLIRDPEALRSAADKDGPKNTNGQNR